MTAPQQFSPDGQWWWDGTQWVPAAQAPEAHSAPPAAAPAHAPAGPAYPAYGYPAQPLYGAPVPATNDGKAIGSLVASLVWVCGLGSIIAVILGHLSRSDAKKHGRPASGLATAGLVLGYLGIAGSAIVIAAVATHTKEITSSIDSTVELQSAADAEHRFHDTSGRFTSSLTDLAGYGYTNVSGGAPHVRVLSATATTFCLTTRVLGEDEYMTESTSRPTSTPCS